MVMYVASLTIIWRKVESLKIQLLNASYNINRLSNWIRDAHLMLVFIYLFWVWLWQMWSNVNLPMSPRNPSLIELWLVASCPTLTREQSLLSSCLNHDHHNRCNSIYNEKWSWIVYFYWDLLIVAIRESRDIALVVRDSMGIFGSEWLTN